MTNKTYVERIMQATGLDESKASKVLVGVVQGFLDAVGEKSHTSVNISPTPDSGTDIVITVTIIIHNPPGPH